MQAICVTGIGIYSLLRTTEMHQLAIACWLVIGSDLYDYDISHFGSPKGHIQANGAERQVISWVILPPSTPSPHLIVGVSILA